MAATFERRPLPAVSWRRAELPDQSSETDAERGIVRNEMVIEALKREDLLTEITCQASNTNLSAPITAAVKLDISLNPTEVQITTSNKPCSAGERIEIVCVSKGSRPPAKISWWKDGKDLKRYATDEIQDDVTTSKLFLTPSSDDNEKVLICRAENPVNADSALEDQWILNVYYAPIVTVTFAASQQNELIREGSDVHLECNIQSNPPATDVRWRFHSKSLPHDPSKGVLLRNNTLTLQNVQRSHRGRYRCLASNLEGESISDEVVLRVQICKQKHNSIASHSRHLKLFQGYLKRTQ
ncbi:uncharacterized protein CDAR_36401 [Caerostris darwini]|uniref:Ig-like domain-containing protein n=1 Tax=Caerostris darwini TaxID=1538125 RepID=A0AAV4SQT9_9ARAC|nr:uncharacterized protein CDAR_36401 [Caerostris darwini]